MNPAAASSGAGEARRGGAALVLVDYQVRLMGIIHRAEQVVAEAVFLARCARELGIPVVGTEQNPAGLGPNAEVVKSLCDPTVAKMHFDACRDGLLEALPRGDEGPARVVVAGCEAHVCLLQTVLGLRRAGFPVAVAAQACGSRRPQDHALAMQRLERAGADIVGTEMQVFEWLDTCRHPRFRPVLELVKARAAALG